MDFGWALQQMRAGKIVMRTVCTDIWFKIKGGILYVNADAHSEYGEFRPIDYVEPDEILALDWVLTESPDTIDADRLWKAVRNAGC
jgi:hypothetical protein